MEPQHTHFKETRRWEQRGECRDGVLRLVTCGQRAGRLVTWNWDQRVFGFGTRAGLIKTDLMRGGKRPWAQRPLVLDGGCGSCVTRVTGYKAMKTLIKEVTELHFRTWLCSDWPTKIWERMIMAVCVAVIQITVEVRMGPCLEQEPFDRQDGTSI